MEWIWSSKQLIKCCKKNKLRVRMWAMEKLSNLYPGQAGDIAIKIIEKENEKENLVSLAVNHFLNYGISGYEDRLFKCFQDDRVNNDDILVHTLAKWAPGRFHEAFLEKFPGGIPGDACDVYAHSLRYLAQFCPLQTREITTKVFETFFGANNNEKELPGQLFLESCWYSFLRLQMVPHHLLGACLKEKENIDLLGNLLNNIGYFTGYIYEIEEVNPNDISFQIFSKLQVKLGDQKGKNIKRLFDKEQYETLVQHLRQECITLLAVDIEEIVIPPTGNTENQVVPGYWDFPGAEHGLLVTTAHIPGDNHWMRYLYAYAIDAFAQAIPKTNKVGKVNITLSALALYLSVLRLRDFLFADIDNLDDEGLTRLFFGGEAWKGFDEKLVSKLVASPGRERIYAQCLEYFKDFPYDDVSSRIPVFMLKVADSEQLEDIIKVIAEFSDMSRWVLSTLISRVSEVLPSLEGILERMEVEAVNLVLYMLKEFPIERVVDFVLEDWDYFLEFHYGSLMEIVKSLADRRFINKIKPFTMMDDCFENNVYVLLCQVNGVIDPRVKELEKIIERQERYDEKVMKLTLDNNLEELVKVPLRVEVECRHCEHIGSHDVKKVFYDPELMEILIDDAICCPACGLVNDYEISSYGRCQVITRAGMLVKLLEEEKPGKKLNEEEKEALMEEATVKFFTLQLLKTGEQITIAEAIERYEAELEKKPTDPGTMIGFANILIKARRSSDAINLYEQAYDHDPLAVEALACLSQIAEEEGESKVAYNILSNAVDKLDIANYYMVSTDLDEFKDMVLTNFERLAKKLRKPLH